MRNEREWELSKRLSAFLERAVYPVRFPGWNVEHIEDKARQATHGDLVFRKGSSVAYVDEKAYASVWDGCLIELMQDLKTFEPGWFRTLTHCTHLICGYYRTASAPEPVTVYKVAWPKLREAYMRLCRDEPSEDKPTYHVSPRGYGLTLFVKVKWWQIKDCVELLWGKPAFIDATDDDSKRAWDSTAREKKAVVA